MIKIMRVTKLKRGHYIKSNKKEGEIVTENGCS
jgi:hypothetical protein